MLNLHGFAIVRPTLIIILFAVTLAACNSSQSNPPRVIETGVAERLQAALDQAVADKLPGVGLSIRGEALDFDGVAGVENLATVTPITSEHRFYAASIGKTYTAVAAVRMAADGLLSLDDPITLWLPTSVTDRIPSSSSITIRTLLNHTSGLFDFHNDNDDWNTAFLFGDPNRHWTNADIVPYLFDKPLHFEPATDYRYSDSNYVLAALILEAASGLSIQDVIRYYVIAPLGLQQTVHGVEATGLPGFIHGYVEYEGQILDVYPLYSHYGLSDGGIQTSVADLAEFVHAMLTTDSVLSEAMRAELLTPPEIGARPSTVALGVALDGQHAPDYVRYFNAGKDVGSRADFHHLTFANQSLTIAFSASASLGDYDFWYEELVQAVFNILYDAGVTPAVQL